MKLSLLLSSSSNSWYRLEGNSFQFTNKGLSRLRYLLRYQFSNNFNSNNNNNNSNNNKSGCIITKARLLELDNIGGGDSCIGGGGGGQSSRVRAMSRFCRRLLLRHTRDRKSVV